MTGEVINLRRARKQRARSEKRRRGDQNAAQHGRSAAEQRLSRTLLQQEDRKLDGLKREAGPTDSHGDETGE